MKTSDPILYRTCIDLPSQLSWACTLCMGIALLGQMGISRFNSLNGILESGS